MIPQYRKLQALDMQEPSSANVIRLLPRRQLTHLDPIARFEEFTMLPPAGFPLHEHRGFESVTYVLKGYLAHTDNLHSEDTVAGPGDLQHLVAGKGVFHAELPVREEEMHGVQIWIALPRAQKAAPPSFEQVSSQDLPEVRRKGVCCRSLVGPGSPVATRVPVTVYDLELSRGRFHALAVPPGHCGLVYVLDGRALVESVLLTATEALVFEGITEVTIEARRATRALVVTGSPLDEPIRPWSTYVD